MLIDAGSVHFDGVLEAGTPYPDEFASMFAGVSNTVVVDSVAKAIFAIVLFLAIVNIFFSQDKMSALKSLFIYFAVYVIFYLPWVGGNYLFPATANLIDNAVKNVCQYGIKGFSPYGLADSSAIPEIALGSFNQVMHNEPLRNRFTKFKIDCYAPAKKAYAASHPNATATPPPDSPDLAQYYASDVNNTNGINCAEEKASLFNTVNANYKSTVDAMISHYQEMKITGGGSMAGNAGLSANAQDMAQKLGAVMKNNQSFRSSVFNQAVEKADNLKWSQSEDTRSPLSKAWDTIKDVSSSWINVIGRALLLGIFSTAKWFFDRHLYDIVGVIKLTICCGFPFLFLYSLVTLNPDPLLKLMGSWLFASGLYIIAAIQEKLWYAWGGGNVIAQIQSIGGAETVFGHAMAVGGFIYLFSFTLAGILTWNALAIGSALFGPFAGGIMSQLKSLPSSFYPKAGGK